MQMSRTSNPSGHQARSVGEHRYAGAWLASLLMISGCGSASTHSGPDGPGSHSSPVERPTKQVNGAAHPQITDCSWSAPVPAWTAQSASTFSDFEIAEGQCASEAGCPFAPAALTACPPNITSCSAQDVAAGGESLEGRLIAVSGPLEPRNIGPIVLVECRCCLRSRPVLHVAGLQLRPSVRPEAFDCFGDWSQLCCGFQRDRVVVAVGTLRKLAFRDKWGARTRLVLEDPVLCAKDQPARDSWTMPQEDPGP